MNLQKNLIKKISFLLIVSILSINLSFLTVPKKAEAWGVTFDPSNLSQMTWEFGEKMITASLAATAKSLARRLISNVTQETVNWINGGMNGNPAYVADFNTFMTGENGVLDQVVGDFIKDSSLSFLCDPFRLQVKLALSLQYSANLTNILGCTLSKVEQNIRYAPIGVSGSVTINGANITGQSNFTSQGGWDSWLNTTLHPQNNPVGAYLIAKGEMDAQIQTSKEMKTIDIASGQGALSFRRCIDTYIDAKGNRIGSSEEYMDMPGSRPTPPNPSSPLSLTNPVTGSSFLSASPGIHINKNCTVKTPGSVITGMLTQKATTDVEQNELTAALSDGIDTIFSTLVDALLSKAISQLKKGVLDPDLDSYYAYNAAVNKAWLASVNNNYSKLNDADKNWTYWRNTDNWTKTDGTVITLNIPTSTLPNIPPVIFSTGTIIYSHDPDIDIEPDIPPGWNFILPTSTISILPPGWTHSTTSEGYIIPNNINAGYNEPYTGGYSALGQAKNNSTILINSLAKSELSYQNNYKIAQNVLTKGRNVFATSSTCNMNYGRTDSVLRSLLIRTNVITNIDGISNSDRTIASIPWNLEVIKTALKNSDAHLVILNKASSDVSGAGNITKITDAMIPVNSTSFNTDSQEKMVGNIKTWLRGVQGMYNSSLCPIDLTKVLQITSATSTAN